MYTRAKCCFLALTWSIVLHDRPMPIAGGEAVMGVARAARLHRPDHGLTLTQVTVLGTLDRLGTTTVAELADRCTSAVADGEHEQADRRRA